MTERDAASPAPLDVDCRECGSRLVFQASIERGICITCDSEDEREAEIESLRERLKSAEAKIDHIGRICRADAESEEGT